MGWEPMDEEIITTELIKRLDRIGKMLGMSELIIRKGSGYAEIFVKDKHALLLEIDWRDFWATVDVVYLKDGCIPENTHVYYDDGHWCRKSILEIYHWKPPKNKNKKKTYPTKREAETLYYWMNLHEQLINNNPGILIDFYNSLCEG